MLWWFWFVSFVAAVEFHSQFVAGLDRCIDQVADDLMAFAVMPTVFSRRTSSQIIRAPVYVLPAPGGHWIGRMPLLRWLHRRTAAWSVVSIRLPDGRPPRRGGALSNRLRAAKYGHHYRRHIRPCNPTATSALSTTTTR